tara:strand:- start:1177 stop:2493 length:1317 start_codon:yes stop_codon:yes gene_type:complete
MPSLPSKTLFNIDSLPGMIRDPMGMIGKLVTSEFEQDGFGVGGVDVFRAIVISQPTLIEPSEYRALGYDGDDIQTDRSYKKFKVRIARKANNPHAILQDPCDLTKAADKCDQNALVATHTTVATHQHTGINMGSFIEVRLHKNYNETYNLQTAEFVSVLQINETGAKVLNDEFCDSIKIYFKYGDSYSPPPPITVSSGIRELAQAYDKNKSIPGKSKQKKFLYGNKAPAVKAPFDQWAKALIQLAYENGFGAVVITSGYRTVEHQQGLHDAYKAGRRKLPAACGTCSRHTKGFALDLNFYDRNGTFITSKTGGNPSINKKIWEDSEFVTLAKSIGLEWGGDYDKYDPVHFEWTPSEWGENAEQYREQMGYSPNRNYDVINEGNTIYETYGRDEIDSEGFSTAEGESVPAKIAELDAVSNPDELGYDEDLGYSSPEDDY